MKYTIHNLRKDFPNEEACLNFIFEERYSKNCECGGSYSLLEGRKQFQCSKCRKQIAPLAGTVFHKSSTSLVNWFHALFIFSNAKSGISAKELERHLGVTYKTAYRMLKQIRTSLGQETGLFGLVETDEAYMGGKARGAGKRWVNDKTRILGIVERGGRVVAYAHDGEKPIEKIKKTVLKGSTLISDGHTSFKRAPEKYKHKIINHRDKGWRDGIAYTHTIEGFFNHLKTSLRGTHKVVSGKHLQGYLDGFAFHWNHPDDHVRFQALVSNVLDPAGS